MSEKKFHTIPVVIDSDVYAKLKELAKAEDRSVTGYSRNLLTQLALGNIKVR